MNNEKQTCATMAKYAGYANRNLMELHCGVLPHPGGWVVFSNLGQSAKVNHFIDLLRGSHATDEFSWNEEQGATFALLILEEDEPGDLSELWDEACGIAV